ncbi:intraflagellar transport protein 81 homolog [Neocloeon triangulifer]|uniref:intraflagellar transport protein 81 homolog n=1 Tax=Neocloeon triangulifer TaxID=2078957 RepID=UPI00286F8680|nr:intraflagellar transport protein 81 homolog [Neocloeon triangulifer]
MSSQLKFVVDELKALYPKKNYNIIEFDGYQPDQLVQILSNVSCTIEGKDQVDTRAENREMTVKRLLNSLYIMKYRPPSGTEYDLAQSLFVGEKSIILPILEWLLRERQLLEKRAYLGKYLMKIEVPAALRGDSNLEELYENYEQLLEAFKDAHREREQLVSGGSNAGELRGDLAVMEREREIVAAKVATLQKTRVEGSKANAALLARVKALREARAKRDMLLEQKARLQTTCAELERFVARTKQQVTEARRAAHGVTPQGLLQRAEEEEKVSTYIANEKIPADIKSAQTQLQLLREVASQTCLTRSDLAQVEQQVRTLSTEVNALLERRMAATDPADDKLAPFKQQAAMLGRKKEAAAEALGDLKRESATLKAKLEHIQGQLLPGEEMPLTEEQYKRYLAQLKPRTELFKARRSQLSSQTAECGVLSRTLEVLRANHDLAQRQLADEERRLGLSGYSSTASQLEEVDAAKTQLDMQKEVSLEALSKTILELNQIIATKKAKLAPAIQELRPLREQYQSALADFNKVKQQYDATAANIGSASNKIEQEIKQIEEETRQASAEAALLEAKTEVVGAQKEMLEQEMAYYKAGDKAKSLRDRLNAKIAEEEKRGRHLKEVQRTMKDNEPANERQAQLWENVEKIFAAKLRHLEAARRNSGVFRRERGAETLTILN